MVILFWWGSFEGPIFSELEYPYSPSFDMRVTDKILNTECEQNVPNRSGASEVRTHAHTHTQSHVFVTRYGALTDNWIY